MTQPLVEGISCISEEGLEMLGSRGISWPPSFPLRGDQPPALHLSLQGTGTQGTEGSRSHLCFVTESLVIWGLLLRHPEPLFPHLQNRTDPPLCPFHRLVVRTGWDNERGIMF